MTIMPLKFGMETDLLLLKKKKKKSVLEAKNNDKNIYLGEVISLSLFRAYFHLCDRLPINVSKLFRRETH